MIEPPPPRFTRDEQAFAVWISHTVIPVAVSIIAVLGYGHIPLGFIIPEAVIWTIFTVLLPSLEAPAVFLLRMINRDEYLVDVEALRRGALPAAFAIAFVLQFVALGFLLADTGGPITSPFAAFVVVYAVFSSLLTTRLWSLGVTLLVTTSYYAGMVLLLGFGSASDQASVGVYLAVTLLIIWLTVWLAFLSRLPVWTLQSIIDADAVQTTLVAAVATQIWNRPFVSTRTLPARRKAVEAALAEYATSHPELALRIVEGRRLEWVERKRMMRAQALTTSFEPETAARLFATSLGLHDVRAVSNDVPAGESVLVGTLGEDAVLPSELLIRATAHGPSEELLKATGRTARREVSGANIAVMLVADASNWMVRPTARTAQRSLATSVVVLDTTRLLRLAGATIPRRALMTEVLQQADLSKADPFVVEGPTRPAMFFGRSDEESAVTALLRGKSAALIGGRRTGKTSLLQRIERTLRSEGWLTLYADLQAVGDWVSFAELISLSWDVEVPPDFRPSAMPAIVREVGKRHGDRPLVIMLDEVDRFARWDGTHRAPLVSETFFRSCRGLSQEGEAQFVLAGERVIAERLWSPDSPHWNFCQPVAVRQLARADADQLLVRPIQHLQVEIADPQRFLDRAWRRTSGHPHLVQYLGRELIALLNDRDPERRRTLTAEDVVKTTDEVSFRERYISTYQGQATPFEKSLCNLAAAGATTLTRLRTRLDSQDRPHDDDTLGAALRMLDLYGILETSGDQLVFRAEWMPDALRQAGAAGSLDPEFAS